MMKGRLHSLSKIHGGSSYERLGSRKFQEADAADVADAADAAEGVNWRGVVEEESHLRLLVVKCKHRLWEEAT